jgi:hypothetical protein
VLFVGSQQVPCFTSVSILWTHIGRYSFQSALKSIHSLYTVHYRQYMKRNSTCTLMVKPLWTDIHLDTIYNSVRTSQETDCVSAPKPERLMPFGRAVAVYCENHTEHINTLCGHFSPYLTGNISLLRYKAQISSRKHSLLITFLLILIINLLNVMWVCTNKLIEHFRKYEKQLYLRLEFERRPKNTMKYNHTSIIELYTGPRS